MLPGFRFLITAIVMCMSILVFGLGATALMRAAHEDFATNTSWRAPPEPRFAEQDEAAKPPVLAVLSLSPHETESTTAAKEVDDGPAAASADGAPPSPAPDRTAALSPAPAPAPDTGERDAASEPPTTTPATTDDAAQSAPSPAPAEVQPAATGTIGIAKPEDSKPTTPVSDSATIGKAAPAAGEPAPPAPQQPPPPALADAPATLVVDEAATRIATLGGPPVPIEDAAAKALDAKADRDAINKKLQAEHAKEQRRRLALRRERLAQQQAAAEASNPFAPHPLIGTPPTPVR
jgi:hypothetical protein